MILSPTQEFSDEVLQQKVVTNIFHISNKADQKKEKHVPVENKGLTQILQKLWQEDLPGKTHIESYLRDQYRRNLRLTTIKNSLTAIVYFLVLAKQNGKNRLEEITRRDLGAFIEHEQDRGLKPATVRFRLDLLKAFVRYQIEKEVISAEVLFKRMVSKFLIPCPKPWRLKTKQNCFRLSKMPETGQ